MAQRISPCIRAQFNGRFETHSLSNEHAERPIGTDLPPLLTQPLLLDVWRKQHAMAMQIVVLESKLDTVEIPGQLFRKRKPMLGSNMPVHTLDELFDISFEPWRQSNISA